MTMGVTPASAGDLTGVLQLLRQSGLPVDGLADHLATTLVIRDGARIVGCAALEVYGDGALLRSVAVSPELRGAGAGRALTGAAFDLARVHGVRALYLLTTTAEAYFPRFGFARIARADVPSGVQRSIEFTSVCPSSAVVMHKEL